MALRAQEISQEAGSKIAQAMKDVINAAAGIAGFAVESARDIVQYMVRRGQMTQEEADRIIREAEEAHAKRKPLAKPAAIPVHAPATPTPTPTPMPAPAPASAAPARKVTPAKPAAPKPAPKAAKAPAKKPAAKKPAPHRAKSSSKVSASKKRK